MSHAAADPAPLHRSRPVPPLLRYGAWAMYLIGLGLACWLGVKLAWRQVPPVDPDTRGPLPLGSHISPAALPADYPLAATQQALRDYLFVKAAGADPSEYIEKGAVHLLSAPTANAPAPTEDGLAPTPTAPDLVILKYDGDLALLRQGESTPSLWGPVEPLEDLSQRK